MFHFLVHLYAKLTSKNGDQNLSLPHTLQMDEVSHVQESLTTLIEVDGAGTWPPRSSYGTVWPRAIQPYHNIYLSLSPGLACDELSMDQENKFERCLNFRTSMKSMLQAQISLEDVNDLLSRAESGASETLRNDSWNGFFACIAMLSHAFRWGTIPIVKLAQEEQVVDLPQELVLPWGYLKRRFGVTSPGGNVTSNYLCNFTETGKLVYPINTGGPNIITTAEYNFSFIFREMEIQALPVYKLIVKAIEQYSHGEHDAVVSTLASINTLIRVPLRTYYQTMVESQISRTVWLQFVQGFQGWAAGTIDPLTGVYTEYDGLSGNQVLFPQVLDAFLGLGAYLSIENSERYIPQNQRRFCESVRKHNFRDKARRSGLEDVEAEMLKIAKQMRVFRTAHMVRVKPYLSFKAPERLLMTAGKSVLEKDNVSGWEEAIAPLENLLVNRLAETR